MRNTITASILAAAAYAVTLIAPAQAEYFPRADANAQRSLTAGLGRDSVPVLERQTVGTTDATFALLKEGLPSSGGVRPERDGGRLRLAGADGYLEIFADGSAGEFFNLTASVRARASGIEATKAMSAADLEAAGRAYVERNLDKVIVLGPNERMVPEAKAQRIESGVAVDGTGAASNVVAQRVVFTREIDGIPVVGAGSKVTITFLNDGTVESFHYDWPRYRKTNHMQALASPEEILRRIQTVIGARTSTTGTAAIQTPPSAAANQAIDLGRNTVLKRLACGYYDPGYKVRDPKAPVQAGCYYHVVHAQGSGDFVTKAAYSGAVPAARSAADDARWPEVALLRGKKVPASVEPRSAGPPSETQPVPPRKY
jgi:hypothetical protein